MKFLLKFIHFVQVLTICCNYVAVMVAEAAAVSVDYNSLEEHQQKHKCAERRVRSNENSLNVRWENLHSFEVAIVLNMTQKNLQSINETLFKSIDKASSASVFDLSINAISSIEIGTFEHFHNVRILIMRVNNLREITSQSFEGLMMLEELYLSENAIFDVERDSFRNMENLHTIDLSENCLFRLSPFMFYRNLRLVNVYLNYNYLNHLPRLLVPMSQYIERLNVTENRFTNMTSLMFYTNIQSLDLSGNPLSSEEMSHADASRVRDENNSASSSSNSFSNENDNDDDNYAIIRRRRPSSSVHRSNHFRFRSDNNNDNDNEDEDDNSMNVNRRYVNDNYNNRVSSRLPDRRIKRGASVARMNSGDNNSRNIEYLMDIFRPNRISEEALESLIKMLLNEEEEEVEDPAAKTNDIIRTITTSTQRNQFLSEINENVHVASLVNNFIGHVRRRNVRNVQWQLSDRELKQLHEMRMMQKMKFFICRNCSLNTIGFLVKFSKLKHVDVSGNQIKSVDSKQLASLKQLEYLIVSNNNIQSLNFHAMLQHWPELHVLILNNNPDLSCDLVRNMQTTAIYLHKMFRLEVNKCK